MIPSGFGRSGAEVVVGDLTDPSSLTRAVKGCEVLYHVAADYRLWAKDPQSCFAPTLRVHVTCWKLPGDAGRGRVVYTSTVGCIGMPPEQHRRRGSAGIGEQDMYGAYKRSKFWPSGWRLNTLGRTFRW